MWKPERKPQTIRIYVQDREHTMANPVDEFTITENTDIGELTVEFEEGQTWGI